MRGPHRNQHNRHQRANAIFPVVPQAKKSAAAKEAWNPKGLVPTVVRQIKRELPDLDVITDVALDPYLRRAGGGLTK